VQLLSRYNVLFFKWDIPIVLNISWNIRYIQYSHTTIILTNSCNTRSRKLQELVKPILVTRYLVNWKHYQLYTPPVQRSAWRWPYSLAETCSWNYNLIKCKLCMTYYIYFILYFRLYSTQRGCLTWKNCTVLLIHFLSTAPVYLSNNYTETITKTIHSPFLLVYWYPVILTFIE
jgi:hypothetical protein